MINPYLQYMYSYPHKTAYRSLPSLPLEDYFSSLSGPGHGLYLHIPFCQTKCGYCNLFSVTGQGVGEMDAYLSAVERQTNQYVSMLPSSSYFSSFTIGGGTPLLLTARQLDKVFYRLCTMKPFSRIEEIVIETAPNQTTKEKLHLLKQAGVTRVSMGIQSFFDNELAVLARGHSAKKAREALDLLMEEDFSCVNIDFIYGIPGQTEKSLLQSLNEAISFGPDEIFLYPLYIKHGAGLEKKLCQELVLEPQKAYGQYKQASRRLKDAGFRQDSMRRFVRAKNRSQRKFSDCGFGTSLALGCGGRSYLGKLHFCSPYAITQESGLALLREFEQEEDYTTVRHGILLSEKEEKRRYLIRHLLIYPGLDEREYQRHFNSQVREDFPVLVDWLEKGYLCSSQYLSLSELGLGLSDYLGPQLISPEICRRMEEWEEDRACGQKDDSLSRLLKKL